jgi:hypothetical protein
MFSERLLNWIVLLTSEVALATFAAGMFWYQDWQYSLPTPRPAALVQPELGTVLRIVEPGSLADLASNAAQQPTLLHFFNPACPCSRFNLDQVRKLLNAYQKGVRVIAVLETDDPEALARFRELDLPCEVVLDQQGTIAQQAGVYSTPQGVVLSSDGKLFFRGNYNRGRYCTAPENEFVRRALEACLANEPLPRFPAAATIARGCQLPANRPSVEEANQP